MKNVIINSLLFIFLSLFLNCNKKKPNINLKKNSIEERKHTSNIIFKKNIIIIESSNKLNDTTLLNTYTIKNKKLEYITKFTISQGLDSTGYYRPFDLSFYYYDYDELYRCGVENQHVEIDEQAFYFKIINRKIIIKRMIEKTHWQGRNYMHQLCVKRCNEKLKVNDTINWDVLFFNHFRNNDGSPNKYCRDVITDSIEWEESKPR